MGVLEDHVGRGRGSGVLGGNVDPVAGDHAVVDMAAQGKGSDELAGGDAGVREIESGERRGSGRWAGVGSAAMLGGLLSEHGQGEEEGQSGQNEPGASRPGKNEPG